MTQIDMKMPSSCEDCKICRYDNDYDFAFCPFIRDGVTRFVNERHPKCPLKWPKQGEWIPIITNDVYGERILGYKCKTCGWLKSHNKMPFCENCGAKMLQKEGES